MNTTLKTIIQQGINVVSLFDGISCGRIALERAGISVNNYYAYEIDNNAIKISKNNYPDIIQCGDVTKEDFSKYKDIDLLIGGSPCQSLSIVLSQTRENLKGKSKLFFEYVRALKEIKPKYFLFENVASMNEESRNTISRLLGCKPIMIDSKDFSAQQRQRYYWTNIPVNLIYKSSPLVLNDILENNVDEKYYINANYHDVDMDKQICAYLEINNNDMHKRVFNPKHKIHTLTCVSGGGQQKKVMINNRVRKLTPLEYERLQTLPDNYTKGVSDTARYSACGNGWTVDVIAYIFSGLTNKYIT